MFARAVASPKSLFTRIQTTPSDRATYPSPGGVSCRQLLAAPPSPLRPDAVHRCCGRSNYALVSVQVLADASLDVTETNRRHGRERLINHGIYRDFP